MQKENKSDNHDPASDSPEQSYILPSICIGMILGMLLGFALGSLVFHNIILGLCTGQSAGLCLGILVRYDDIVRRKRRKIGFLHGGQTGRFFYIQSFLFFCDADRHLPPADSQQEPEHGRMIDQTVIQKRHQHIRQNGKQ